MTLFGVKSVYQTPLHFLCDVPFDFFFSLNNIMYLKKTILNSRYKCIDINNHWNCKVNWKKRELVILIGIMDEREHIGQN